MDGTHQRDSCGLGNTSNTVLLDGILGMKRTQANIHITLRHTQPLVQVVSAVAHQVYTWTELVWSGRDGELQ